MRRNAALALADDWYCNAVNRTPSTIGDVEGVVAVRQPEIICDWFQGTMSASIKDVVVARLSSEFGSAIDCKTVPKEMRAYKRAIQFSDGTWLYHENRYYETCCVVLSGKSGPTRHLRLIKLLCSLGVRPTRIDLAFDDRRSVLAPIDVHQATRSSEMVSRWKESCWQERIHNRSGARLGYGAVIGSKTSAAYLSIYDKGLEDESEPEGDWTRWELRLAGQQAEEFVESLLEDNPESTDRDLRQHLARIKVQRRVLCEDNSGGDILDCELTEELRVRFKHLALEALKARLSFRDRTTSSNVSRAMVLPWWQQFLEYFESTPEEDSDSEIPDYDEAVLRKAEKKGREISAKRKAEEALTEIYAEFIRPHQPTLTELVSGIPEWDDLASTNCGEGSEEILCFVGLSPMKNNVVPLPLRNRHSSMFVQNRVLKCAEVIPFRHLRSGGIIGRNAGR